MPRPSPCIYLTRWRLPGLQHFSAFMSLSFILPAIFVTSFLLSFFTINKNTQHGLGTILFTWEWLGMRSAWEWGWPRNEVSLGMRLAWEWGQPGNEASLGMRLAWEWGQPGNEVSLGMRLAWEWGQPGNEASLGTKQEMWWKQQAWFFTSDQVQVMLWLVQHYTTLCTLHNQACQLDCPEEDLVTVANSN